MRRQLIPVLALFLLSVSASPAQVKNKKLVVPGPEGVFVHLGFDFPSPSRGITAYRIERRTTGEKSWYHVGEVQAPASLEELKIRISQSMQLVPPPLRVDSVPTERIWQRMQLTADSLGVYANLLPVRLALGVVHLDTGAARATPLEYKVSHIDNQGKVIASFVSERVFYPPAVHFAKLTARTSESSEREIRCQWMSPARSPIKVFEAYRRDNLSGAFLEIPVRGALSKQKDSLYLDMRDTAVQPDRIYEYYLVPMDAYGNVGIPSDTVRVATYNFMLASTATYAKIENLDSTGGLHIRWELQSPSVIREVTVFRSEFWDSGFTAIADLPSSAGNYVDQNVVPMKDYYYYIEAVGPLGERARSCATMHGLYQSSLAPFPPVYLQAEPMGNGVRLAWRNNEENIKGFYVYRGDAAATSFEQVSPLIPVEGETGSFVDSSRSLSPRFTYAYAVLSENTSHRLSQFSDTVFVHPGIKTSPRAPLGLRGNAEDNIAHLVWQDMYSGDPSLLGFKVLRRTIDGSGRGSADFKELVDSLLPASHNHFTDFSVLKGRVYEYAVQAFDVFGGKSGLSNVIQLSIASPTPLPPTGVRVSKQTNGILVEWDEVASLEVTGYALYRYQRGKNPVRVGSFKATQTEFTDTKGDRGQLYFYYVTTLSRSNVESSPSVEISVRR